MDKQQHHDLGLVRNVESWTLHTSKAFFFLFQNLVLEVSHREFEKKKKVPRSFESLGWGDLDGFFLISSQVMLMLLISGLILH